MKGRIGFEHSASALRDQLTEAVHDESGNSPAHDQRAEKIAIIVKTFPVPNQTFIVDKFVHLLGRGYDIELFCSELMPKFQVLPRSRVGDCYAAQSQAG